VSIAETMLRAPSRRIVVRPSVGAEGGHHGVDRRPLLARGIGVADLFV
jgi:hypothetical protein